MEEKKMIYEGQQAGTQEGQPTILPTKYKSMLGVHSVQDILMQGGATLDVYVVQETKKPYADADEMIVGVFTKGDRVVCVLGDGQRYKPIRGRIPTAFTAEDKRVLRLEHVVTRLKGAGCSH
jgi:hypothetical protein